jgi:serralysin
VDSVSFFRTRANMTVSLDGFGIGGIGGLAEGDLYFEIENIYSGFGKDKLTGSDVANQISGNAGNDTLSGGLGDDTLIGGTGVDRLTGGGGNDSFAFYDLSATGADVITDFGNTAGNNDVLQISSFAFGGGLVAGSLAPSQFRSRNDNVAQDADDRFIFRQTDQSLWFDVDGNGVEAAVLIVDLQGSAVLSVADITLV